MTPDFSRIYAELGLHPDCGLEHFNRAYRQRLSELHPDRARNNGRPSDSIPLSELIALHASAIAFHRQHGRLPGSTLPHLEQASATPRVSAVLAEAERKASERRASASRWWLAALLFAGGLIAGIFLEPAPVPISTRSTPLPRLSELPPEPEPSAEGPLELGMNAASIRAIQGEPLRINGDVWEYGPSWLRIEHNRLVDWYSSPLYRLKTRTPSPDAETEPNDVFPL